MPTGKSVHRDEASAEAERRHADALLDQALEESFPASDPVAITSRPVAMAEPAGPRPGAVVSRAGRQRVEYGKISPQGVSALTALERYLRSCGLEAKLIELVRTRVSQINGCAYCLDMHTKDALQAGESDQRLYTLSAWRETPFFSPRERAALAWAEAVTLIHEGPPEPEAEAELRRHFSEKEIVDLTLALVAINGWNRLAIPFHTPVGSYRPAPMGEKSRR